MNLLRFFGVQYRENSINTPSISNVHHFSSPITNSRKNKVRKIPKNHTWKSRIEIKSKKKSQISLTKITSRKQQQRPDIYQKINISLASIWRIFCDCIQWGLRQAEKLSKSRFTCIFTRTEIYEKNLRNKINRIHTFWMYITVHYMRRRCHIQNNSNAMSKCGMRMRLQKHTYTHTQTS